MMDPKIVSSVLTYALEHGAEFAELFVEDKDELSIRYSSGIVQGIGQALYEHAVYDKDGQLRQTFRSPSTPVYAPNSFGGPAADAAAAGDDRGWQNDGELVRSAVTLHPEDDDWGQAGTLVREVLSDQERERLVANIVGHVGKTRVPEAIWPGNAGSWAAKKRSTLGAALGRGHAGVDRRHFDVLRRARRAEASGPGPTGRRDGQQAVYRLPDDRGAHLHRSEPRRRLYRQLRQHEPARSLTAARRRRRRAGVRRRQLLDARVDRSVSCRCPQSYRRRDRRGVA